MLLTITVYRPLRRSLQRLWTAWQERSIFSLQDFFVPRDFLLEMMPPRSICAEIGVNQGHFSRMILDIVEPRRLHLIDPWKYEHDEAYKNALFGGIWGRNQAYMNRRYRGVVCRFRPEIQRGQVEIHRAYSQAAFRDFDDNYFDWIYIDGNHAYEFVKADLELYWPKVKPGGLMAGDDYDGFYGGWWQKGVKRAVDEFITQGTVDVVEMRRRQFLLRKQG